MYVTEHLLDERSSFSDKGERLGWQATGENVKSKDCLMYFDNTFICIYYCIYLECVFRVIVHNIFVFCIYVFLTYNL